MWRFGFEVWFRFWFRFVSFRSVSFRLVSFRFALYRYPVIGQHSKSRLGYDWCYRLKPGSNQKTNFLRKRNLSIYKHVGYRHVVWTFILIAECRICDHATDRQCRLILEIPCCLKPTRSLLYFLFTRLHTSETSNLIGCLILAHCIILYLEPRLWMLTYVKGLCEVTNH
jgi:hypothetical protein